MLTCGMTCAIRLQYRHTNLRNRLGVECVGNVVITSRLHWFGMWNINQRGLGEISFIFEVDGKQLRGRPSKIWMEVINDYLRGLNANRVDAQDRALQRSIIRGRDRRTFVTFMGHLDGHTNKNLL